MSSRYPTRMGGSRESIHIPISQRGQQYLDTSSMVDPGAALDTALSHSSVPRLLSHTSGQDHGQEELMK